MRIGQIYCSYEGRIGRLAFLMYGLLLGACFGILKFAFVQGGLLEKASPWNLILVLVMTAMSTPLVVKRAHDLNNSGWWVLKWWGVSIAGLVLVFVAVGAMATKSLLLGAVLCLASLGCSLTSLYQLFIKLYFFPGSRIDNDFGPPTKPNDAFEHDYVAQPAPQPLAQMPVAAARQAAPAPRPAAQASGRAPNAGFGRRRPSPA